MPVEFTDSLRLKPSEVRDEIISRHDAGHSLRRISSDLGISYAEVARIAGGLQ